MTKCEGCVLSIICRTLRLITLILLHYSPVMHPSSRIFKCLSSQLHSPEAWKFWIVIGNTQFSIMEEGVHV